MLPGNQEIELSTVYMALREQRARPWGDMETRLVSRLLQTPSPRCNWPGIWEEESHEHARWKHQQPHANGSHRGG